MPADVRDFRAVLRLAFHGYHRTLGNSSPRDNEWISILPALVKFLLFNHLLEVAHRENTRHESGFVGRWGRKQLSMGGGPLPQGRNPIVFDLPKASRVEVMEPAAIRASKFRQSVGKRFR